MASETGETKKRLLISKWRCLRDDLAEAKETIEEMEAERDAYADDLEQALLAVKYWFLDAMVHGKFVKTPREMLQKVEEVLG